jgi:hypothetical protein
MNERAPQAFAWWAAVGAAAIGSLVLVGWALDLPFIVRLHPTWPSMKPNTALSLILSGMSLALLARTPVARSRRLVSGVLAAAVGLMAAAAISSYLFSVNVASIRSSGESARASSKAPPWGGRATRWRSFLAGGAAQHECYGPHIPDGFQSDGMPLS